MTRILLRAPKGPFEVASAETTLTDNLIGNNSGNLVFIEAAWRLLDTAGTTIAPDRFEAARLGAGHINERYDAYVVPLANAFRLSFREQLERLTTLIEGLRIPVVVLGVGAQANVRYEPGKLSSMDESVKAFVKAVLDRSPSIGVRGEYTQSYLQGLGFRDVEVIGCPSMFLNGPDFAVRERAPALDRDARLSINVSPYVKAMGPIVLRHLERYPNLGYIAQDSESLELLLWGESRAAAATANANPIHLSHPLFSQHRTRLFVDPWPWLAALRDVDFSFGTRIHGNIAALLAGTPAFVLAHDSRTLELARYFAIPHLAMTDLPTDVDAADLYALADTGPLLRGHAARWATFKDYLARHGLHHVFEPGQDPTRFPAKVAATPYPPAVEVTGNRGLSPSRRRLRRSIRAVRRELRRRRLLPA